MKYYIDTEFYERGFEYPIQLISLGIVSEDGREYYAESDDINYDELSDWLKSNVVPNLTGQIKSREQIIREVLEFMGWSKCTQCNLDTKKMCSTCKNARGTFDNHPEFWAYFADYDWVLFCQLFGTMIELPRGMPKYCNDLIQLATMIGVPKSAFPKQNEETVHNALADAKWNKRLHEFLIKTNKSNRRV